MTLAEYSKYWFENIAPNKLASSTVAREKSDIDRFLLHIGHYKLTELRSEHFRKLYVALRKEKNMINGKPLSELTVEGVHACLCGILSDAVESGLLDHNPAWRTYKYSNIDKKQQVVADEEILQKPICALEKVVFLITFHVAENLFFPKLWMCAPEKTWSKDGMPVFSMKEITITEHCNLVLCEGNIWLSRKRGIVFTISIVFLPQSLS